MSSEKDDVSFPKLGERNYRSWSAQCKAALMRKKCWRLVSGAWTCPATDDLGYDSWMEMNEMACGIIFGLLDETRQNLVLDEFSAVDSKAIWDKLEAIMMQKKPSSRFHAYEQLFSSVLQDGEGFVL